MVDTSSAAAEQLQIIVQRVCGPAIQSSCIERGDLIVNVAPDAIAGVLKQCKESAELDFAMLIDLTAVDWMDSRAARFEVVYQLLSISKNRRLTIKVPLAEGQPQISTATGLWSGANFLEREVWDMFGISFIGHPDLRRILMYEEFKGHPLRKDYPVQGKQPRIALRAAEVENTARKMLRGDLVSIRSRSKQESGRSENQGA
jgi:NADH-quinone oxidoreductase subunit C